MKNIVVNRLRNICLLLAGLHICAGAGVISSTSSHGTIEQHLAVSTAIPTGIGISWAEEEDLSPPPEYDFNPEYIKALSLTTEQAKALHSYMPGFKQWSIGDYPASVRRHYPHSKRQLPYAVSGDFDGNGRYDIIVAGHAGKERMILAVMAEATGNYVLPILEYSRDPRFPELDVVFLLQKGTRFVIDGEDDSGPEKVIPHDGIQHTALWGNNPQFSGRTAANHFSYYSEGLASVALVSVSSAAPSPFKPEYLEKMALPPPMKKAVHAYDNNFKMWGLQEYPLRVTEAYSYSENALPYAVRGDFNGDGVEDMVVDGHNTDENRTLVLLSSGTEYSVEAWSGNQQCYLRTRKQGNQISHMPSTILRMHGKGLQAHHSFGGRVTLRGDVFSYQPILSCAASTDNPDENTATTIRYGDWREVDASPTFYGYIKKFNSESYHNLRILTRSTHEKMENADKSTPR